jgi:hypothetical protein
MIIFSTKLSRKTTVSGLVNQIKSHKKLGLIIFLVTILVVILTVVSVILFHHLIKSKGSVGGGSVCPHSLNLEAAQFINSNKPEQLNKVVAEIRKRPNYENDPNCLYPVVMQNVYAGQFAVVDSYMAKLKKVYNPKIGFDSAYVVQVSNPNDIEQFIASQKKINEEFKKNSRRF